MNSTNPDPPQHQQPKAESSNLAILILVSLLSLVLMYSYARRRWKIRILHESLCATIIGMIVGGWLISLPDHSDDGANKNEGIRHLVSFDPSYFFNLLLPPIILHSGYALDPRYFFQMMGSILLFAIVGTFLSSVLIGFLLISVLGWHQLSWTFLECWMFGSILSSTDPVAVLAIFNQLRVDPRLYALVFGESMLNDATSIVLYHTLDQLRQTPATADRLLTGILSFMGVFTGSCAIGVLSALFMALVLKHTRVHRYSEVETCWIFLTAYGTYLLSNALKMTGIVSLLFCGITMKHYAEPNFSKQTRHNMEALFQTMAVLAENFVFIYLGVSLFTQTTGKYQSSLIFLTFLFLLIARAFSVFCLARLVNAVAVYRLGRGWKDALRELWPADTIMSRWFWRVMTKSFWVTAWQDTRDFFVTMPRKVAQLWTNWRHPRRRHSSVHLRQENDSRYHHTAIDSRNSVDSTHAASHPERLLLDDHATVRQFVVDTNQEKMLSEGLIPENHQVMLWWAGLRGAIAFALSMDMSTPNANEIRGTTLFVVVMSLFIFGGTSAWAIEKLKIRCGVSIDETISQRRTSTLDVARLLSPTGRNGHWFISFDEKYLYPFFTREHEIDEGLISDADASTIGRPSVEPTPLMSPVYKTADPKSPSLDTNSSTLRKPPSRLFSLEEAVELTEPSPAFMNPSHIPVLAPPPTESSPSATRQTPHELFSFDNALDISKSPEDERMSLDE